MGMDYSLSFDYEDADLTHLKLGDQIRKISRRSSLDCEQYDMSTDVAVCFYCNDLTVSDDEDSSEPNADSEKTQVLDNCAPTDQSEWEKQFQESPAVSTGQQNLLNNESSVNISMCHRCGILVFFSTDD
jgi:hypothetical protein